MALATQCPHCQTTFRVAQDQLKLRAGLVRCGHCKEIFNGIEHLLPPTDIAKPAVQTPVAPAAIARRDSADIMPVQQATEESSSISVPSSTFEENPAYEDNVDESTEKSDQVTYIDFDIPQHEPEESAKVTEQSAAELPASDDPLQRMTLMDFTQELPDSIEPSKDEITHRELSNAEESGVTSNADERDELDEAIEDLQRKPWRSKKKSARVKNDDPLDEVDSEEDEPGFLKRGRRDQRFGRKLRVIFGLGSVILLIAALAQGTYLFRNQIAGFFPQTKPMLAQLCSVIGCHVDLPAQIASVSIESSELQTLASAKDRFVLTTLLRNYSSTSQEWPYIELTLNDGNEKPLLRRVFKPIDYMSKPDDLRTGLAADSERTVKLTFELSQVQASGYRVYLFYP
jgi:predicted Zn finger-like uncharacterized protein